MRRLFTAAALSSLSACATDPTGRILHYERSDADGSQVERVSSFQTAPDAVVVYKMRSRCTNAALVTARFDLDGGQATSLVGGRLTRSGAQEPFAWLEHDARSDALAVRVSSPDSPPLETAALPSAAPWRLYDFDFADFNALARPPVRARDLTFDLALIWPEPADDGRMMRVPGVVRATWRSEEAHLGEPAHRYGLSGAGMDGGDLWLAARDGVVLEVRSPLPNHPGYGAFRLRLTGRDAGDDQWRALLADHWRGCPAA